MKLHLILALCFFFIVSLARAIVDSNENSFSDIWERHYNSGGLFPEDQHPQSDPDGDGWTNEIEAISGTDPFNANAPAGIVRPVITHIPAVHITGTSGDPEILTPEAITLTWPTTQGKQYTLLYAVDLVAGEWWPLESSFIGNGGTTEYTIPLTQPDGSTPDKLFWRVAVNDVDSDSDDITDAEEYLLAVDADHDGVPDEWERYISWILFTDYGIVSPSDPMFFDVNANYGELNTSALSVYQNLAGDFELSTNEAVASPYIEGLMKSTENHKGGFVDFTQLSQVTFGQDSGPIINFFKTMQSDMKYIYGLEWFHGSVYLYWDEEHGHRVDTENYLLDPSQGWISTTTAGSQSTSFERWRWIRDNQPSPSHSYNFYSYSPILTLACESQVSGDPPVLTDWNNRTVNGQWTTTTANSRVGQGAEHWQEAPAVKPVPGVGYEPTGKMSETFVFTQTLSDPYTTGDLITDAQAALMAATPVPQMPLSFRNLAENETRISFRGGKYRLGWTLPTNVPLQPGVTQAKAVFLWQEIYDPETVTATAARQIVWKHASKLVSPGTLALTEWYDLPPPLKDGITTVRAISPSGSITFLPKGLLINKDDDDGNGQEDRKQAALTLAGENDLIPMSFSAAAPAAQDKAMIHRLEATGGGNVRLWAVFPNQGPQRIAIPYKLQPCDYPGSGVTPPAYYLEATEPGAVSLKLHAEVMGQKLALLATAEFKCLDLGIDFASNMKGVIGDVVVSNRPNSNAVHFVTTKSANTTDTVELTATGVDPDEITPLHDNQLVEWVGAAPTSGMPHIGLVSRATPDKYPASLRVIATGQTTAITNVWVTWANLTLENNTPKMQPPSDDGIQFTLNAKIEYRYNCLPNAMFDLSQDIPNFNLTPNPPAPGGTHAWTAEPLANGASIRYDATRQVRAVMRSSDSVVLDYVHNANPKSPDIPDYPTDIAVGNDDPNMAGELIPYLGQGGTQAVMRDTDYPHFYLFHTEGQPNADFLLQAQFRQYARVQIASKWYLCSDLELSDLNLKFKKTAGKWTDDNSSFVIENGTFPPQ